MFEVPPEVWTACLFVVPWVVLGWQPWRSKEPRTGAVANALAPVLAAGMVLHGLHAIPDLPPTYSKDWLPIAIPIAGVLGVLSVRRFGLATLGTALLVMGWTWFAFSRKRETRWAEDHALLRTLALCGAGAIQAVMLCAGSRRIAKGPGPALALLVTLSVTGWLVGNQFFASGGAVLGACSAGVGPLVALAWLRKDWNVLAGWLPPLALLTFAVPVHCWADNLSRSASLGGGPCTLLVLAPLAALLPGEGRRVEALRWILTIAVLAGAVAWGWPGSSADPYGY